MAENPGMGKENRTGARRVFSITNGFCAADRMETGGKICSGPQSCQFDMQEKAEQYLNEAAEIPGMEEDIFYQQIRKRWEEAG